MFVSPLTFPIGPRGGLIIAVCLSLFFAGACTSGKGKGECRSYCNSLCEERSRCPNPPSTSTCVDECLSQAQPGLCDRSTVDLEEDSCEDLARAPACQSYCAQLCTAAQACGTVNEDACLDGCNRASFVLVCEAATIEARACPDLLAEANCHLLFARDSEDLSRECRDNLQPGVCKTSLDCPESQACNVATHLCGACSKDAVCAEGSFGDGALACIEGKCEKVECATNDDCLLSQSEECGYLCNTCDVAQHRCVECVADSDCTEGVCDTKTNKCAGCRSDADCSDKVNENLCDTETLECVRCLPALCDGVCGTVGCVECESDQDCTQGWECLANECGVPSSSCSASDPCVAGAKCSGPDDIGGGTCVECESNTDCKGADLCDTLGRCVQCIDEQDCPDGDECFLGRCR